MELSFLEEYPKLDTSLIKQIEQEILVSESKIDNERLSLIYSLIDLTSLNSTDSESSISLFVKKAIDLHSTHPNIPLVPAICVYPNFISVVKKGVGDSPIKVASVGASFPSGQSFIEVKKQEVEKAVELGADEIDIVLNRGKFLEKNYTQVIHEIKTLKKACGDAHLKVILEIVDLVDIENITTASLLAIHAGADFIKTSTGKGKSGASIQGAIIMCQVIREYYRKTGKKIGFKPAGGISSVRIANLYLAVVEKILGKEWLNPDLFRIGASSLADEVLEQLDSRLANYYRP